MKNKEVIIILCIILLCFGIICGAIVGLNRKNRKMNNNQINTTINTNNEENISNNFNIESENQMISNIKVIINGNTYDVEIEDNETAQAFMDILPQEFNMSELNGNEKYIYLNKTLPTNSYRPERIEKGDVMLYGDNCLVIFYKSFNTSYSYTKIGHIDNLPDLGNGEITISFEKR